MYKMKFSFSPEVRYQLIIRWFHVVSGRLYGSKSNKVNLGVNFKYPLQYGDDDRELRPPRPFKSVLNDRKSTQTKPQRPYTNPTPKTVPNITVPVMNHTDSEKRLKPVSKNRFRPTTRVAPTVELNGAEILFGISPVTLALEAGRRTVHRLFLKEPSTMKHSRRDPAAIQCTSVNTRLDTIEALAADRGIPVTRVSIDKLDKLSEGRPHQGTCMDVDRLFYCTAGAEDTEQDQPVNGLWLFLDKIHDPMNLGAIIRSAYYFGVDRIINVKDNTCPLTPVVSKASSGAMEIVNVYRTPDSVELLKGKASEGWTVVGTASEDSFSEKQQPNEDIAISRLGQYSWSSKTIVLIGNEGMGLSVEHQQLCHTVLTIPAGQKLHPSMRSLNVGVATGIILQNFRLQLGNKSNRCDD